MLQPHQKLEGQDHADQLPMNRPHDDFIVVQEHGLDIGEDSALGDGDSGEQLAQPLVVPDGQLEVTGDDPGPLVVTRSVASQLEDLSTGGVVTLPQERVDTAHGELESSAAGAGLDLGLSFSSLYRDIEEMDYNASPPRNDTGQDQLPMNRPHDDFEDLFDFPPRNETSQDTNVKQDDVLNTPTCTEPFSNFSDYLSNFSN